MTNSYLPLLSQAAELARLALDEHGVGKISVPTATIDPAAVAINAATAEIAAMKAKAEQEAKEIKAKAEQQAKEIRKDQKSTLQGTCAMTLTGHTSTVMQVIPMFDGRICTASVDESLKVWDVNNGLGTCVLTLTGHTDQVNCVCQLKDGRLVSGSKDESIKVWDLLLGSCVLTLTGHTDSVLSVIVLPDGRVVSGSGDKLIKVWV